MRASTGRILTTHVGSLPRSQAVTDVLFAREKGEIPDRAAAASVITDAVAEVVRRQVATGIDVVSDGETNKISYATYIADRFAGFGGDTPREPGQTWSNSRASWQSSRRLAQPPSTGARAASARSRSRIPGPLHEDLGNFRAAVDAAKPVEAFMNAASPGVLALFQPNDYYKTQDAYLEALGNAMQSEYEAIVSAGFLLQIDAPDFGMGRHTMYRNASADEYLSAAARHVEVLNHALRNLPAGRIRMHICWGNYEGPHHHDIPLEQLLPVVIKAKPQALLFEASNPRHAHEWTVFKKQKVPDDKILVPGVLSTTTNYIEHPELVAERILRFADIVGRERVMAGTDCGFGTFGGFGPVDPDIVYLKLASLAEGARMASQQLYRN
jgi:5-methyltetrahydropteroyltriglutamate--homocysteine methyltransferase